MKTVNQIVVKRLPRRLDLSRVPSFLCEIEPHLATDKPQVVLDCSFVEQIDSAGVEMLLRCMEKAMKQDGDLKLAAVSAEAEVILRLTRIDRVFEIFDTVADALASFVAFPAEPSRPETIRWLSAPAPNDTPDFDMAG